MIAPQRTDQRPQSEMGIGRVGERIGDVRVEVDGRRERGDLGQQLGRRRHRGHHGARAATRQRRWLLGRPLPPRSEPSGSGARSARQSAGVTPSTDSSTEAEARANVPASTPSASSPGPGQQQPIQRTPFLQLRRRPDVDDPAAIEHRDPVGQLQRRAAVGDQQRGAVGHHPPQRRVDLGLDARVDGRGRVVEHEHPRVGQQRAGQRDALPLPAGQGQPALADDRVVAIGQLADELVGLGGRGGGEDLLVGGVVTAVGDVVPDRVGEQEAVLEDDAEARPQRGQPGLADVDPADADRPGVDVVEARQQQRRPSTCPSRRRRRAPASRPGRTVNDTSRSTGRDLA